MMKTIVAAFASGCASILAASGAAAQDYWFTEQGTNASGATNTPYAYVLHYRMSTAVPARIEAPKIVTKIQPELGGDLYCMDHVQGGAITFAPWDLIDRLSFKVSGKSVKELQAILQAAQQAPTRREKMRALFSTHETEPQWLYAPGSAPAPTEQGVSLELLETQKRGEAISFALSADLKCLTPQQIDSAISEATRVVGLLSQALANKGSTPLQKQGGTVQSPTLR